MSKLRRFIVLIALVAAGVTIPFPTPAAAALTVTTTGTTVRVDVSGSETIRFHCIGGNVQVNTTAPTPPISCAAVTEVRVIGDNNSQWVEGHTLNDPAFSSGPWLNAQLGGGNDGVTETARADVLFLGSGNDVMTLTAAGVPNTAMDLGSGTDQVSVRAGSTAVNVSVTSAGPNASIAAWTTPGIILTSLVEGVESVELQGGAGNDTLSAAGVSSSSTISYLALHGNGGNDTLIGGAAQQDLHGGPGTNTLTGGPAMTSFWTESPTDTLTAGTTAVTQYVYDANGLRSGGRTLNGFGATTTYYTQANAADTVVRIRPAAGNQALQTLSLHRTGQQVIPAGIGSIEPSLNMTGQVPHRTVSDVVALPQQRVRVFGQNIAGGYDLADVTVPSGTWTESIVGGEVLIDSDHADVRLANVEDYRVHGPWTNKNQGFGHRVTRDLLLRFAPDVTRDQIRDQLTNGTRTRAQVVASLMNTDEYRGLDVDRVFINFLRRPSDPSGRTYWINAIKNGRSLQIFRAQLFGSNEYFTKAGGDNAAYVRAAYADVLGRFPDPSGEAFWVNRLNNGAERGQVARTFLNTTEARRNIVNDQFLRFLDRTATTAEQNTWITALGTRPMGEQELIAFLAGSTSYYNRT